MRETIECMFQEIHCQIGDLPKFNRWLQDLEPPPPSESGGKNCVFVGAGDSFAAARAAEHVSGFRAFAIDPYDFCLRPGIAEGKHVFVISVSGRTRANIEAAKATRGIAKRVTAITANAQSVLAENCDDTIELRFQKTGELTPGTGSFTATLLACYSRVTELSLIPDFSHILEDGLKWSDTVDLPSNGTTFLVGTGVEAWMAMYGAAKIFEVLGWKAQHQATEQFSHMELFSLSKEDLTILIPKSTTDRRAARLESLLLDGGFKVAKIAIDEGDEIVHSLGTAIYLQVLAWRTASGLGVKECSFKTKRTHLRISDTMIY